MARVKCIFCYKLGDKVKDTSGQDWVHEFDDTSDSKVIVGRAFRVSLGGIEVTLRADAIE